MGLLRKAARAGAREPASASPAAEPARDGRHAGAGLLRKTLGFLASPDRSRALTPRTAPCSRPRASRRPAAAATPRDGAAGVDDIVRRILDDLAALSDGVELPSRLFTSLKRHLSIVKGALLLLRPWAA